MAGRLLYGGKVQTVQFQLLLCQVMHINYDKLIFTYKAYLRIKHKPRCFRHYLGNALPTFNSVTQLPRVINW